MGIPYRAQTVRAWALRCDRRRPLCRAVLKQLQLQSIELFHRKRLSQQQQRAHDCRQLRRPTRQPFLLSTWRLHRTAAAPQSLINQGMSPMLRSPPSGLGWSPIKTASNCHGHTSIRSTSWIQSIHACFAGVGRFLKSAGPICSTPFAFAIGLRANPNVELINRQRFKPGIPRNLCCLEVNNLECVNVGVMIFPPSVSPNSSLGPNQLSRGVQKSCLVHLVLCN